MAAQNNFNGFTDLASEVHHQDDLFKFVYVERMDVEYITKGVIGSKKVE